jgi:hypothetical protein
VMEGGAHRSGAAPERRWKGGDAAAFPRQRWLLVGNDGRTRSLHLDRRRGR